jgi:hypothetical protein
MRQIAAWTAFVIVLAATVSMAQPTVGRSDIVLDLSLPSGATPQLRIAEGDTGSIELPRVGKFGFVPSFRTGTELVVVDVFDLKQTPRKRLDRLEMIAGGDWMQSATKPPFGLRISKVITK